ncbi:MAG: STAS domain-containing protein [Actinomycetales bacterium]|nr:STAS domain-containing protein [Actinomycetales bacterium]
MSVGLASVVPPWLRSYQGSWLGRDIIAGATLAAVAIPECMGYTSIAQTPIVTGLYTIIFPTILFALLGSSRLLVVGADSATAALLAAGLGAAAITGATPGSQEWLAYTSVIALMAGVLLIIARVFKLGFLGDFLSASVLIGFLTGVGVQVATGQIPDLLGIPKGSGNWFQQQWSWITHLADTHGPTLLYGLATILIIKGFERFLPKVPGAVVAVLLLIGVSTVLDSSANGVAVVGSVQGGLPPIGLPEGMTLTDITDNFAVLLGIAFSCFILIIAQSAATSRSFAMKHGQGVDVNRDIVGLSGANVAAGLSGTFVVNGSPTKTQILDGQGGRTQLANLTMSGITLLVVLFFTALLTNMPKSVLAGIVFLIGVSLIDVKGLRIIARMRRSEFVIAVITAVVVCAVGVEQGIILAIVVSILDLVRRQYRPKDFVVAIDEQGKPEYEPATPGTVSVPGLVIFRYDAELFYANANRFVDDVEALIEAAPSPVEWLVLDASSVSDVDYSAARALKGLADFLAARGIVLAVARGDGSLLPSMEAYGLAEKVAPERRFANLDEAYQAFLARADQH